MFLISEWKHLEQNTHNAWRRSEMNEWRSEEIKKNQRDTQHVGTHSTCQTVVKPLSNLSNHRPVAHNFDRQADKVRRPMSKVLVVSRWPPRTLCNGVLRGAKCPWVVDVVLTRQYMENICRNYTSK